MSGALAPDFAEELKDEGSYLAVTFYASLGVILTLVIVIVILLVGYCCLARYIVRRNGRIQEKANALSESRQEIQLEEMKNDAQENSRSSKNNTEQNDENKQPEGKETDDTKVLIHHMHEEGVDGPQDKQHTDAVTEDKMLEDMYASVNKSNKGENGNNQDSTDEAQPSNGKTVQVLDEDYAEVQCKPNPVYGQQTFDTTQKPRAHTINTTATVALEVGNDDYSRLVHVTQPPNPRLSMPLLSDYARIDLSGVKRQSLDRDLDKAVEQLHSASEIPRSSDYESMTDPPALSRLETPPPLPTPVLDDIMELKFGSHDDKSIGPDTMSPKQEKKLDYEMMSDPPKAGSPPPLPAPLLDGEETDNEVLYDNAPIILQNSQTTSNKPVGSNVHCEDVAVESGAHLTESKDDSDKTKTAPVSDGIYENFGKGVD